MHHEDIRAEVFSGIYFKIICNARKWYDGGEHTNRWWGKITPHVPGWTARRAEILGDTPRPDFLLRRLSSRLREADDDLCRLEAQNGLTFEPPGLDSDVQHVVAATRETDCWPKSWDWISEQLSEPEGHLVELTVLMGWRREFVPLLSDIHRWRHFASESPRGQVYHLSPDFLAGVGCADEEGPHHQAVTAKRRGRMVEVIVNVEDAPFGAAMVFALHPGEMPEVIGRKTTTLPRGNRGQRHAKVALTALVENVENLPKRVNYRAVCATEDTAGLFVQDQAEVEELLAAAKRAKDTDLANELSRLLQMLNTMA